MLFACFLLVACQGEGVQTATGPADGPETVRIGSVEIAPSQMTVEKDSESEVSLEVMDTYGTPLNRSAEWQIDGPVVIELVGGGSTRRVKGIEPGSTRIIATVDGLADTADVQVKAAQHPVNSVALTPASVDLAAGESHEITLEVTAEDGSALDRLANWQVGDDSIVKLSGSGATRKIEGLSAGSTVVIAGASGVADTTEVAVTGAGPTVGSVTISTQTVDLSVGASVQLSATVEDSGGDELDRSLIWSVGDSSVASVDSSGRVSGLAVGSTDVLATVDDVADTVQVDVTAATTAPAMPSSVSVAEESRTDTTVRYQAQWSSSDGADSYRWTAGSNNGTWSDSGSSLTSLQAVFTAPRSDADDGSFFCVEAVNSAGASEPQCEAFTVPARSSSTVTGTSTDTTVASVSVSPTSATVEVGYSVQLAATATNAAGDTISAQMSWSSTNSSVATVDAASGKVTGQSQGTAGIVATADNGVADTATVDVTSSSTGSVQPDVVFDPDLELSTTSLRNDSQDVFLENEDLGPSRLFLDTSVARPGGSKSMRYDWVDQGAGNAISIGRKIPIGQQKEVWVEADVRWSDNWMNNIQLDPNDGDPSTDVAAHKFLFLAANCVSNCTASWEISDGTKVYRWALLWPQATTNPPDGGLSVETPAVVSGATDGSQILRGYGHNLSDYIDGQWHTVRFHIRHDPGEYEMWVDGVKLVDLSQDYSPFTIRSEVATTALLLGRNKDDGNPTGTESLWWGKISVWTSNPGWP